MRSNKATVIKLLAPWTLLVVVLLFSSPTKLPSTILIVPFVLLFIAIYFTITLGILLLKGDYQPNVTGTKVARSRLIAGLVACLPVLLLTMQSIGQLTAWDVLMVGGLFVIAYFYIVRSSVTPSSQ